MSETDKDKEIAELRARIVKLENAANPPPRPPDIARLEGHSPSTYRLIDQMSLPPDVFQKFVDQVPDEVVKQLRGDGRK